MTVSNLTTHKTSAKNVTLHASKYVKTNRFVFMKTSVEVTNL